METGLQPLKPKKVTLNRDQRRRLGITVSGADFQETFPCMGACGTLLRVAPGQAIHPMCKSCRTKSKTARTGNTGGRAAGGKSVKPPAV